MKEQALRQRMAEIEAVARNAIEKGGHRAALLRIIAITEREG